MANEGRYCLDNKEFTSGTCCDTKSSARRSIRCKYQYINVVCATEKQIGNKVIK